MTIVVHRSGLDPETQPGLEDDDENMDPPVYAYWVKLEEREARGRPKLGNDVHIREIEEEQMRAIGGNGYHPSVTESEESEKRKERREWIEEEEARRRFDRMQTAGRGEFVL